MELDPRDPRATLLKSWSRDLSVCTAEEMEARWRGGKRDAIAKIDPKGFDGRLKDHNPIYFLAERVYFNNVPGDPAYLYPPLHRDKFCKLFLDYLLEPRGGDSGLVLMAMRDSFKSTFSQGTVPLWYWLRLYHLDHRFARIGLIHQKELQASANLMRLKAKTLSNPWLKRSWPEVCANADYGTKTEFSFPCVPQTGDMAEHSVIARGLGADLTGFHFDLLAFDDLVIDTHRTSKVLRDQTALKYDSMMYTLDSLRGKKIHTGTPYHATDQWGRMYKANVEGKAVYKFVRIPAIEPDNSLNFPSRQTYESLEQERQEEISRTGNDDFWNLQKLCEYRTTRMLAADPSWLKMCPLRVVPQGGWRVIIVDPAWKGTQNAGEGDFAAIEVWELFRHGAFIVKYLLDGVHSNTLTDRDGRSEIFRLCRKWGVTDCAPEERGGYAFRTALADEANTRGWPLNVIALKSMQANKQQRIVTFLGEIQAGRVFIVEECDPEVKEAFIEQFQNFPQVDNDDAIDCAAYTSDPAISECYAPQFNVAILSRQQAPPLPMRSRYSGI